MRSIVEFIKKHDDTTVTFDYDKEFDQYSIKVRDFDKNKAWTQKFSSIDFEDNPNRITKCALDMAEKEIYSV